MKVHIWDNGQECNEDSCREVYFIEQGDFTYDDMSRIFHAWSAFEAPKSRILGIVQSSELERGVSRPLLDALASLIDTLAHSRKTRSKRKGYDTQLLGDELASRLAGMWEEAGRKAREERKAERERKKAQRPERVRP